MRVDVEYSVSAEGFVDQLSWIGKLLSPLKTVFTQILTALKGNLTIGDNVTGVLTTASVKTNATYTIGSFTTFYIPWRTNANPPFSVLVGKVVVPSNQSAVLTTVTCTSWSYVPSSNTILVQYIAGLANNSTYNINITVL